MSNPQLCIAFHHVHPELHVRASATWRGSLLLFRYSSAQRPCCVRQCKQGGRERACLWESVTATASVPQGDETWRAWLSDLKWTQKSTVDGEVQCRHLRSAQCLGHSNNFFSHVQFAACAVCTCPKWLLGGSRWSSEACGEGARVRLRPQRGSGHSIARAQGSSLVILALSPALPHPCVTWGKARTGLLVLKTTWPRKQIFNLAQFVNLDGDAAQGMRWY